MALIPLYQPAAVPDAWHQVTAPGGYETWHFEADDPAADMQIVVSFALGGIFQPRYLRAYERFIQNPTRTAPPVPGDWPCVGLSVYRGAKILWRSLTQYAPADFRAANDAVGVTIGPNTFARRGEDLCLRLHDHAFVADLTFTPCPILPSAEQTFLSRTLTGVDHKWVIANPACDVAGTITPVGGGAEPIVFTGRGGHDHYYGTGPIGPGLWCWVRGRALLGERVVLFQHAFARDPSSADDVCLVQSRAGTLAEVPVGRVVTEWPGRRVCGARVPARLAFDDALVLHSPRVIDRNFWRARVQYRAEGTLVGEVSSARVFCEIVYPRRLSWPLPGRLIERLIR